MKVNTDSIIKEITDFNNCYRDSKSTLSDKLIAMWEIGNLLQNSGVKKPHSLGWRIQEKTKGLIKRPTVFRSFKVRKIWQSKNDLLKDIGRLRQMSFLTEILPLIDPDQIVRDKLSDEEVKNIFKHACLDDPAAFKRYVSDLKRKFSHGRLGQPLDKSKHLRKFDAVTKNFRQLQLTLMNLMKEDKKVERDRFRAGNTVEALRAFSNMCISLTTKENIRLYRKNWLETCRACDKSLIELYNFFLSILNKNDDTERARLRRLISAEALAEMSDMISSLQTEEAVEDFKSRKKLSIGL